MTWEREQSLSVYGPEEMGDLRVESVGVGFRWKGSSTVHSNEGKIEYMNTGG